MDGGGRFRDNICIERCWKTAKYEEGYWKAYKSVTMRKRSLQSFLIDTTCGVLIKVLATGHLTRCIWSTLPKAREAI